MPTLSFQFVKRWWAFDREARLDPELFFLRRRELLFGRILIFCCVVTLLLLLKDLLIMKVMISSLIDLLILSTILFPFWLLQSNHQLTAKCFFLSLMNGFIFFYAASLPSDRGIYLYFFPLITIAFAIFEEKDAPSRLIFVLLPVALLLLVSIANFTGWGFQPLTTSPRGQYNFSINVVISSLSVTFFIYFIINANAQSEALLQKMTSDLQAKKENIEKINKELDRFVYSTSHDLRAPISSIKGLIKIALMDNDLTKNKDYFAMIEDRAIKLEEFIQEITDYSRNARTELVFEPADVGKLIEEVITNLKYTVTADHVQFEIINDAGILMVDRSRLKIVMNNLISNAIKYQNLQQLTSWVKIVISVHDNLCSIIVSDNGIGIEAAHLEKVFNMFYRATQKSNGSGLGLYIVKEIANLLNGSVTVTSQQSVGTEFKIIFPVLVK